MQSNPMSLVSLHMLDAIVEKLAYNFELVEHYPCFVTFENNAYISLTIPIKDDSSAPLLLFLLTGVEIGKSEPNDNP